MGKQRIDKLNFDELKGIVIGMYADLCYASGVLDGLKAPSTYISDRIANLDEMLFTSELEVKGVDTE